MYQQTSLLAYLDAKEKIGDKQQKVYDAIKKLGKCTDQQIASLLNWTINRVTPRRGELHHKGMVKESGIIKNEFNRPVMLWEAI